MSHDRSVPCIHYVCFGECKIKREANMNGYCKHCSAYKPRNKAGVKLAKEMKHKYKEKKWKDKYYD
jgi:hypothetical protein